MSTLIFDFDGTIADSMPLILRLFSEIMNRPEPSKAEVQRLKQLPTAQVIRELKVPLWRVPYLLARGRSMMATRLDEVRLFDGIPQTLQALHAEGHEMFIVSSNSARNVQTFLKLHHLDGYFKRVYGGAGLTGKAPALRKIMRQNHIAKANAMYVGDEVRDIEAAAKVGIPDIAVTWGFNGEQALVAGKPFALAHQPADIVTIVSKKK